MLRYPSYLLFLLPALLGAAILSGQNAHRDLRSGDKAYRSGQFEKAESRYRQATQAQPDAQSRYNLGNALYEQKKYADAATAYEQAARSATDADTRARALYNLGNAHYQQKQLDKAIEAYKEALRNSPGDADTARNLALAQQQSNRQSESGSRKQERETGNANDAKAREPEETQNPERETGNANDAKDANAREPRPVVAQREGASNPESETRNPKSEVRNQKSGTAPPETDKLLQIMAREEQKVQQRLRRTGAAPPKSAKDW